MHKLLRTTILLVFSVLILNCSSDDSEGGMENTNPIVGTWQIISFQINGIESLDSILEDNDGCPFDLIFTETDSSIREYNGPNCALLQERFRGAYCIDESTLTFECFSGGRNIVVDILELTDTRLRYVENNALGETERTYLRQP